MCRKCIDKSHQRKATSALSSDNNQGLLLFLVLLCVISMFMIVPFIGWELSNNDEKGLHFHQIHKLKHFCSKMSKTMERIWFAWFSIGCMEQNSLNVDIMQVLVMHMVMSEAKYANVTCFCMPSKQKAKNKPKALECILSVPSVLFTLCFTIGLFPFPYIVVLYNRSGIA